MLYFKALLEGLSSNLPRAITKCVLKLKIKLHAKVGKPSMQNCRVDALAGQKFKVSDKQRIIRALKFTRINRYTDYPTASGTT